MPSVTMEARIALKYTGPAVESGLMNVYEAAANMIALSEFVVAAAKIAYGDAVDAKAEVAGFAKGSFVTDLVINFVPAAIPLLSAVTPADVTSAKHVFEIIKGAFGLWKHLKGEKPKSVVNHGQYSVVENHNGDVININIESLNLTFSSKGTEAVEKFVREALSNGGMDKVEVLSDSEDLASVSQSESAFFTDVAPSRNITDVVVPMGLTIESPVFKDDNKWRFHDGQISFHAHIEDSEFLARVNAGERFGKGDVLYADVRIAQEQSGMKITAHRSIAKVHKHELALSQAGFFGDGAPGIKRN